MKLRPTLVCVISLLLLSACNAGRDRYYESASSESQASPLEKEYALAMMRSWYYRQRATSRRAISDQPRENGRMHQEIESSCPDRYHLKITGAIDMERYIIGQEIYERRNGGPWKKSVVSAPFPEFAECARMANSPKRQPPDEAEVEANSGMLYGGVSVAKGPITEYQGIKCQEYTVSFKGDMPLTSCFSLAEAGQPIYRIHTDRGVASQTEYDFNKPIKIEPPKM